MSSIDNMINQLDTSTIDNVILKQQLLKLKNQIMNRNALLDGLTVSVWDGFDTRSGMIDIKWKDHLDDAVLNRYFVYYS